MNDLIARLEASPGPDLDLDHAIAAAIQPEDGHGVLMYTASVDAALTLVPKGWDWSLDHEPWLIGRRAASVVRAAYAMATCADGDLNNPSTTQTDGRSDIPAIALCIAAIKARDASGKRDTLT